MSSLAVISVLLYKTSNVAATNVQHLHMYSTVKTKQAKFDVSLALQQVLHLLKAVLLAEVS